MSAEKRHLLITGLPGTGKTTVLVELTRRLSRLHPAGFYTDEVRERGERRGFRLVSLAGEKRILADVHFEGPRVGRYGVDLRSFETFLLKLDLLSHPSRIVFIDEIGKMECLSARFADLVAALLASGKTVVATVARKGEGLIEDVKERADVQLVEVTRENRDELPDRLMEWLERHMK